MKTMLDGLLSNRQSRRRNWTLWFFAIGLLLSAASNWSRWRRDRALALSLRAQRPGTVDLKSTPKVSVLVAAWNEADLMKDHIESFLRLRHPNKELILCAGGKDGTFDLARLFPEDQLVVLEQRAGEGKQRALQRCLERSSGEIIFLTDADCLLSDDAFERTLAPIINDGEVATTGTCRPLRQQLSSAFVRHRWFTDLYSATRRGNYVSGLLGRNAALRRDVLTALGEFKADVRTGTDYYLGKQVLSRGMRIRYVADSEVETRYSCDVRDYSRQQTRWIRNVVMHGLRFGAYREVAQCLLPAAIGLYMLAGPFSILGLGRLGLAFWLVLWDHMLISRIRYMRYGELLTGYSFEVGGYLSLPALAVIDFAIWALTLWQYPFRRRRAKW